MIGFNSLESRHNYPPYQIRLYCDITLADTLMLLYILFTVYLHGALHTSTVASISLRFPPVKVYTAAMVPLLDICKIASTFTFCQTADSGRSRQSITPTHLSSQTNNARWFGNIGIPW